ncbi:sialidase-3 isoform X2 [Manacus candei]|uniref:sialidase-3 isoform X2 n=1 Tax=Manacus candei TaxID=415023 RepID=UPI00222774FD|nr:sialidase-3 isoform X2 [Manacus candei]
MAQRAPHCHHHRNPYLSPLRRRCSDREVGSPTASQLCSTFPRMNPSWPLPRNAPQPGTRTPSTWCCVGAASTAPRSRSGTIFLFCICVEQGKTEQHQIWRGCSAARLCFATSADGGRSWAPLRDVTDEAVGADLSRWATFAVGPGHGIQLDSGRLVVPAYTYYMHGSLCGAARLPCSTRQHSLVFYSDDGGRRWHKGALLAGERTGECQVAEIHGAHPPLLYCSARAPRGCRAVALSTDRGLRFQHPTRCPALAEPPHGCQGSVVSFAAPASTAGAPTWLLYSHPTSRHHRRDLGVYVNPSPLDGAGWRHPWVLHAGPAGYSDLAVCPGRIFGCLFECGTASACEEIVFCLFTLDSSDQNLKAS